MANHPRHDVGVFRVAYQLVGQDKHAFLSGTVRMLAVDAEDAIESYKKDMLGTEMEIWCEEHKESHHCVVEDILIYGVKPVAWVDGCTATAFANMANLMKKPDDDLSDDDDEETDGNQSAEKQPV